MYWNIDFQGKTRFWYTNHPTFTRKLDNGVAVKLKEARAEVEAQLTGTALTDLQGTVKESTDPLKSLKGMFVESFLGA